MEGKTAIVTGAASGIGRHFAGKLLAQGCHLALADLNEDGLHAAFTASDRLRLYQLDVTSPPQWQQLVANVVAWGGNLDYLFNIAGVVTPGYIHETGWEQIDRHLDINAKGTIYGSRAAAEVMVAQGSGHIINIASLAGVAPVSGISLYTASKFAVRGFSLAIGIELKPHDVYVSVICPDLVDTPMLDTELEYEEAALVFSGSEPLTVDQVANAIFQAMRERPLEILLPAGRGWTARIAGFAPSIGQRLFLRLWRQGQQRMAILRSRRRQGVK